MPQRRRPMTPRAGSRSAPAGRAPSARRRSTRRRACTSRTTRRTRQPALGGGERDPATQALRFRPAAVHGAYGIRPTARPRVRWPRSSRECLRERSAGGDPVDGQLVLGERMAERPGLLVGRRPADSAPGSCRGGVAAVAHASARSSGRRAARRRRPRRGSAAPASGRTQPRSRDDVMTTAVIPRRSRGRPPTSASASGSAPSASTAARSCMILRCWRPPRSAGRTGRRWPFVVSPTARFSRRPRSAIEAAARTATSTVESSPLPGLHPPLEVEEDPDVGGLLEVELLDLDLAVAGGRLPVDPVEAVARGVRPDGRRERASSGGCARAPSGCPRCSPPGRRHSGSRSTRG